MSEFKRNDIVTNISGDVTLKVGEISKHKNSNYYFYAEILEPVSEAGRIIEIQRSLLNARKFSTFPMYGLENQRLARKLNTHWHNLKRKDGNIEIKFRNFQEFYFAAEEILKKNKQTKNFINGNLVIDCKLKSEEKKEVYSKDTVIFVEKTIKKFIERISKSREYDKRKRAQKLMTELLELV